MKHKLILKDGGEHTFGDEWPDILCFRCAVCCIGYQPQITDPEIDRMAEGLGISREEFIREYVNITQIGYLLRQDENGCVFLRREVGRPGALCSIHLFRPDICRNWQARLIRRQCIEGLGAFPEDNGLLRVDTLFEDIEERERFCDVVEETTAFS